MGTKTLKYLKNTQVKRRRSRQWEKEAVDSEEGEGSGCASEERNEKAQVKMRTWARGS